MMLLDNEDGNVKISNQVIVSIVEKEIIEIVGVGDIKGKNLVTQFFKSMRSNIGIDLDKQDILNLHIPIKVLYGTNIQTIAYNVQKRLKKVITEFLGIYDVVIHIKVEGLFFNED